MRVSHNRPFASFALENCKASRTWLSFKSASFSKKTNRKVSVECFVYRCVQLYRLSFLSFTNTNIFLLFKCLTNSLVSSKGSPNDDWYLSSSFTLLALNELINPSARVCSWSDLRRTTRHLIVNLPTVWDISHPFSFLDDSCVGWLRQSWMQTGRFVLNRSKFGVYSETHILMRLAE